MRQDDAHFFFLTYQVLSIPKHGFLSFYMVWFKGFSTGKLTDVEIKDGAY